MPRFAFIAVTFLLTTLDARASAQTNARVLRPRALRPTADALVPVRHEERDDDLALTWGRDAGGVRVMCATFDDGARTCHAPGLPRLARARAQIAGGVLLSAVGFTSLAYSVKIAGTAAGGGFAPVLILALGAGAGGVALIVFGGLDARANRRGVRWLRAHNARVTAGSTFGLWLEF